MMDDVLASSGSGASPAVDSVRPGEVLYHSEHFVVEYWYCREWTTWGYGTWSHRDHEFGTAQEAEASFMAEAEKDKHFPLEQYPSRIVKRTVRHEMAKPLLVGREQAGSSTLPTEAKPK